ncbi:MAG: bifunctional tetrahydrofolate synthase/dihydrofolate synthase [Zoogloeaceae bacterium]|jgi:dihydrofolate synthase/folylpolyglutamate synthase|nr:bifunctional tetrahydrofolate synthase/dihydrofolate synthase [Zoogloeaceae bacterium]
MMKNVPRDLSAWLIYLESLHPKGQAGIELGLARARRVSAALGQRPFCPIVTVAGTNGKGSTVAYLESILVRAGFRVGCYTSPHLLRYNERVRVDGRPASDAALCAAFAEVEAARRMAGNIPLTYFEFGTLAAWQVFAAAGCEALALEVGLGGRLDAVNLYDADVALVTVVDLDHQEWLGADRESVGFEKAGIFRAGRPALCGDADPPQSLLRRAAQLNAPLRRMGWDFGFAVMEASRLSWQYWRRQEDGRPRRRNFAYPGLRGKAQLQDAALAVAALETLADRLPVSAQAMREGLAQAALPGRFQVLPKRGDDPVLVLDVAHNPQAMRTLAENLAEMGFFDHTYAVLGMLADKDVAGSVAALRGKIRHWFLASLPGIRGLTAAALAEAVRQADPGASFSCHASPRAALAAAQKRTRKRAGENDRIAVFGSFHTVAAALEVLASARRSSNGQDRTGEGNAAHE